MDISNVISLIFISPVCSTKAVDGYLSIQIVISRLQFVLMKCFYESKQQSPLSVKFKNLTALSHQVQIDKPTSIFSKVCNIDKYMETLLTCTRNSEKRERWRSKNNLRNR